MKLFISGQRGALVNQPLSPAMVKAKRVLDRSKDGELFTSKQLAAIIGSVRPKTLTERVESLPGYAHMVRPSLWYWGKPKTINQLKKEVR